jgi:hypothetical protein
METLIPILANILAPAVLDFLFGSDESGSGEGTEAKLGSGYNSGIIAKVGYPRLERH